MGRNLPMSFAQETSLWHEKCVCVSVFLCLWYQAFAAKQMRTALIWVIMQWVVVISYWCFGRNYRSHLWGSKIQNGSWTLKMGPIACSETSVINYPTCCVIIQKSTVLTCVCGCTLSVLLITAIQVSCGKQPPWVHLLCPDKDQHWLLHHYVQGQPKWPHVCPKRQLPLFFFCGLGGVKQENWETSIVSILPYIDSYISWWISMGCVLLHKINKLQFTLPPLNKFSV